MQGDMAIQETGKGESRRQAASACSRTGGRRKAGVGGNSSQIRSSTKIVPATWQESVQMSQIQEPGSFFSFMQLYKEQVVETRGPKDPLVNIISILRGVLSPRSFVYQSDDNDKGLFLPE